MKKYLALLFLIALFNVSDVFSQIKGEEPTIITPDSIMVFESPRPLINNQEINGMLKNAWGIDLVFSNSGFGAGTFLERMFSEEISSFVSLYISGLRNSDELEFWDGQKYIIPGKINRLFTLPLMFGIKYSLFSGVMFESLTPYVSMGVGPNLIISTPYEKAFFDSFGDAKTYVRFGGFIGLGAKFGSSAKSLTTFNLRYYYAPFGGEGIESVMNHPIQNAGGGIYLSLSLGLRY